MYFEEKFWHTPGSFGDYYVSKLQRWIEDYVVATPYDFNEIVGFEIDAKTEGDEEYTLIIEDKNE